MAKIPDYIKNAETGGVTFPNANAYAQRRKIVAQKKLTLKAGKDSKKSINSMKQEIKDLRKLVYDLIEDNPKTGTPPAE
jgi:hypothetical protein